MDTNTSLQVIMPAELVRLATDVAGLCRDIVTKTAVNIQDRQYVRVEGWMAIATAHGCSAGATDVKQDENGTSAIGEIRRISDGTLICRAEGFVGKDEATWYGGPDKAWDKINKCYKETIREKRPDYAIRAMAQTRAISRACRSAFAHVVVMMDAGLSTTPAEEVPYDGFHEKPVVATTTPAPARNTPAQPNTNTTTIAKDPEGRFLLPDGVKWGDVAVHFGKNKGKLLGECSAVDIRWFSEKWEPKPYGKNTDISTQDKLLIAAVNAWLDENNVRGSQTGGRE